MKKLMIALLLMLSALMLTACGEKKAETPMATTTTKVPTVINASEYTLYQNIFYNDYGSRYDGKQVSKRGVFTSIQDEFSGMTRYYVWGNLDQTLCCDWQWELQVEDPSVLPAVGSLIDVSGTFKSDESALDGYWIANAKVETLTAYKGATADIDMTTMSGTLERVQLVNMVNLKEAFEGKTVFAYGRIYDSENLQDPYYDGSWVTSFSTDQSVPAVGTSVVLRAVMEDGVLAKATIETTNN